MTANPTIFELKKVRHSYNSHNAIDIKELSFAKGSITGLMGPNGSGKSTLLKLLAFAMKPTTGAVLFNGKPELPFSRNVRFNVTLLTQDPYLLKRTVYENIRYGLKIRKSHGITCSSSKQIDIEIKEAMTHVGLDFDAFARRKWDELSGGEAQRVAMAARLALKPQALLLDEPTASVDTESAERIKDAAKRARDKWGTTVIVASHDKTWLHGVCDNHINLVQGSVVIS